MWDMNSLYFFPFFIDTNADVPIPPPHFAHIHPSSAPPSLWLSPHCFLCLWVTHIRSLANPFTFFHPALPPTSPRTAVSLFLESMPLFLFCSSADFVHYISRISEIIWCLSFSDQLISLCVIISRSIHAIAKGKISLLYIHVIYSIV